MIGGPGNRRISVLPSIRKSSKLLLAVTIFVLGTFFLDSSSFAAGRLTIRPTGLVHIGQVVTVTGVGFTPGDEIYLVECYKTVCNNLSITPTSVTQSGTIRPTHFRLLATTEFRCGFKTVTQCFLSASTMTNTDKAEVRINFRRIP